MRARACVSVSPRARWLCSQKLDLRKNKIGDDGMRALADALAAGKCPALEKLHLMHNQIGDDGMRALADAVAAAPSLKEIGLRDNPGNTDPVKRAVPAGCEVYD